MPTRHDVIMTSPALIFPADSFAAGKPGSEHRPDFEHRGNPLPTAGAIEFSAISLGVGSYGGLFSSVARNACRSSASGAVKCKSLPLSSGNAIDCACRNRRLSPAAFAAAFAVSSP